MRVVMSASAILALVLLSATSTTQAIIGTDQSGSMVKSNQDEYLMCDKCNWATSSGSSSFGGSYWKLVCGGSKTNSSSYAWINWDCEAGCTNCNEQINITLGEIVKQQYNQHSYYYESRYSSIKYGQVPATFQCCPNVLKTTLHADSTCSGSDKDSYTVAGCASGSPGSTSWTGIYCSSNGASPDSVDLYCSSSAGLNTNDACPSDVSTCSASLSLANTPCVTASGLSGLFGTTNTYTCQLDGTQECLRMVDIDYYLPNMTGNDTDLSALTCISSGASQSGSVSAAVLLASLATLFFAVFTS